MTQLPPFKPFKWYEYKTVRHDDGTGIVEATTVLGTYELADCSETMLRRGLMNRWYCKKIMRSFGTLEEAKAACELHLRETITQAFIIPVDTDVEA